MRAIACADLIKVFGTPYFMKASSAVLMTGRWGREGMVWFEKMRKKELDNFSQIRKYRVTSDSPKKIHFALAKVDVERATVRCVESVLALVMEQGAKARPRSPRMHPSVCSAEK